MVKQVPTPPLDDQAFLDNFLQFGITHYYTAAKLLSSLASSPLSVLEQRSIALEVAALTSAAFELLVTWYYCLQEWRTATNKDLLVDILNRTELSDKKRVGALDHARNSRIENFCGNFGIMWRKKELQARGIESKDWQETARTAKQYISQVLENLEPKKLGGQPSAWMVHYLNKLKHGLLVLAAEDQGKPTVEVLTEGSRLMRQDGQPAIYVMPCDAASLNKLLLSLGQITLALFQLVCLVYISTFDVDPKSIPFSEILKDVAQEQQRQGLLTFLPTTVD